MLQICSPVGRIETAAGWFGHLSSCPDLAGHAGTSVTEKVYRHELRPVLLDGATAMDETFPDDSPADEDRGEDRADPD